MKKLLVLVLVLAFASLANATYMITLVDSTITITNDAPLIGGINMGLAIFGEAVVSDIAYRTGPTAPVADPIVNVYSAEDLIGAGEPYASFGFTGGWTTVTWGDPSLTPNASGMWFTATVTGTPGTVIALTDDQGVVFGGPNQSVIIPEPATIALLCIGGLLLRKKK